MINRNGVGAETGDQSAPWEIKRTMCSLLVHCTHITLEKQTDRLLSTEIRGEI